MSDFFDYCYIGMGAGVLTTMATSGICIIGGSIVGGLTGCGLSIWISVDYIYPAFKSISGVSPETAAGVTAAVSLCAVVPAGIGVGGFFGGLFAAFPALTIGGCSGLTCCSCATCAGVVSEVRNSI